VLNLASETDPAWVAGALRGLEDVILDHAHCEKKAAGMAVQLIFRYPQHHFLLEPLSRLAREELAHFEEVLRLMEARGIAYARQKPSRYAGRLHRAVRDGEPGQLLDTLLCSALIESRSCERFGLLADAVDDDALAAFYRGLLAAEARHHGVYVDLARRVATEGEVRERLAELAKLEAEILTQPADEPRMHS
jgi:tRNA-(ms[2]io[6]A)-hydroxylase